MIAVIQRAHHATVYADGVQNGEIGQGLVILLGVIRGDTEEDARLLAEKISKLRIFCDAQDKMNLSVNDVGGGVLVVSNFTLGANYAHGNRPDYLNSAPPEEANALYEHFLSLMRERVPAVACGVFGAEMKIDFSADGPVTIVMQSEALRKGKKQ